MTDDVYMTSVLSWSTSCRIVFQTTVAGNVEIVLASKDRAPQHTHFWLDRSPHFPFDSCCLWWKHSFFQTIISFANKKMMMMRRCSRRLLSLKQRRVYSASTPAFGDALDMVDTFARRHSK